MKKAIVLGCGLIGSAMVRDLCGDEGFRVTAADVEDRNLQAVSSLPNVSRAQLDLADAALVRKLVSNFDVVLGALPSTLGLATLAAVLESRKPYVDISFMNEDPLQLDGFARERGTTAIVDCGVAPGLANMIIGYCSGHMDTVDRVEYCVGGLPKTRRRPYEYKAPFAPYDVIEEYTRPARMVEDGQVVVKPALSEPVLMDFPQVGTLEAFNTDGLRSLLKTINARNMKEKTLRYPGHRDLILALRETGFFGKEGIEVKGIRVAPADVTARLLFPLWALEPGEQEFTLMRVVVEGSVQGCCRRYTYDLYDEYEPTTGMTSMARTTGFPCVIVARMLAEGSLNMPGVHPPEVLGMQQGMLSKIIAEMAARGVFLHHHEEEIQTLG